ncbi:dehydrogenase/reductase SDR family member 11-like [Corticium candelabrum]|uniref:dehydrogenase/reductase SDR family member 11-like n=1 Tax=Corticium candelabrum TaxID=121492 RepID=UPI002E2748F5|nr:dehydrogenase/reductase SDR family member 11-like [Corticium candelabrum]
MDRWRGRVALVTGASVGIGASVVEKLVEHGMTVVGCARNVAKIEANAEKLKKCAGKLVPVKCDLRREEEILAMFELIKKEYGGVDVCINNAGCAVSPDSILSGSTDSWRTQLEVNVLALCICSRESVKQMREKNADDGQIVNLSSMSGHRIPPFKGGTTHFYSSTKFAVNAITEATRRELRELKTHIRVAMICPGLVRTEFQGRLLGDMAKGEELYASQEQILEADDIASLVVTILQTPPHVQIHDILVRPTAQVY